MENHIDLGSVQIGGRWYIATAQFYDASGKAVEISPEALTYQNLHNGMRVFEELKQHLRSNVTPAGEFFIDKNGMHFGGQIRPLTGRVKELWDEFDRSISNPLLHKVAVLAPKAIGAK